MKRSLAIVLVCAVALVGACGDDDETGTETGSESEAPAEDNGDEGEQAAGDGGFCSAYSELLAGDPTPEQIRAVGELAPEAAKEPLETIAAGFEDDPEGFFDTEEFETAFAAVGDAANDECADEVIDVTAIDYGYEGIPSEVSAGTLGVNFTNEGEELHEMLVLRKNDGVSESWDELLEMDEEASQELVSEQGGAFAYPGVSSSALIDVTEPGEYMAICFIPVGTTPDVEEDGDGPPHFTEGMRTEFTVG